jgi:putative endonuclease
MERRDARRLAERRWRYRRGYLAEWTAAALLITKGYRILSWRHGTPAGEIDLVAKRGRRLAFVEVKRRTTIEDAHASLTSRQRERVMRAAELWLARHPAYRAHDLGFDVVFLVRGRWPEHIENGL